MTRSSTLYLSPNGNLPDSIPGLESFFEVDAVQEPTLKTGEDAKVYDCIIFDLAHWNERREQGRDWLNRLLEYHPASPIVVVTDETDIRSAVELMQAGASDYLILPLQDTDLESLAATIQERKAERLELQYLRDEALHHDYQYLLKTKSQRMRHTIEQVRLVAPTRSTVLLSGETGTGKTDIAKLIHASSDRRDKPFISVHCASLPESLLESEIFGHEVGAFTGAKKRRPGKFEIADQGTIFLDEIGTISLDTQVKLLTVLQERVVYRVGGNDAIPVDVRVISATNEDLNELCKQGKFRKDLYYRLNVFPLSIPMLQERTEDLEDIIEFLIQKLNRLYAKNIKGITPAVLDTLKQYDWPGNIRELENVIERAYIIESSDMIRSTGVSHGVSISPDIDSINTSQTLKAYRTRIANNAEKLYIEKMLQEQEGNVIRGAALAGMTTRQFYKLMTKYDLDPSEFR